MFFIFQPQKTLHFVSGVFSLFDTRNYFLPFLNVFSFFFSHFSLPYSPFGGMMHLYNILIVEDTEMSDFLTSNTMLMLEKSMNFQWTKQSVLLDNIANAETPN